MITFKFGLVSLQKGGTDVPQCLRCYKTFTNNAMCPACSKRHLTTTHSALIDKPKEFFILKSLSLTKAKLDMHGTFQQ